MENAANVTFNESAPAAERKDALAQMHKSHAPTLASQLLPQDAVREVIDFIKNDIEDQEMAKASRSNVIPWRGRGQEKSQQERGMKSVFLDDLQININGDWYERPGAFGFDQMRAMVEQTPILNAVVMTRMRQVQRFCRIESGNRPGYQIRLKDREKNADTEETNSIKLLQGFFQNCGWETNARQRMRMKRDNFSNFMGKLVRDSLTMDSAPIETEFKRDRKLGIDGIYAVDGATIRLCSEEGYRGDDEIFALQVVQGNIRTAYTYDNLIYVPRNPRSDVIAGGYGLAETELLIRVVTGFLNAFTYNTKYFDSNAIPKGMLHLTGNYAEADIAAFKRFWNSMVKGVSNSWTMPVMISKDQESKAGFENFGVDVDEMMFGKWMSFLASLICAIYGISPDEINFESFTTGKSSLSGDDTEEKIANSKDKGLLPLLSYFDSTFTDFIVSEFGDKYEFEWTGLKPEDTEQLFEELKLCNTANELRAKRGEDRITAAWGDAPLNPSLIGAWQAEQEAKNEDYGDPQANAGAPDGKDFGSPDDDEGDDADKSGQDDEGTEADDGQSGAQLGKSYGLPVFAIET